MNKQRVLTRSLAVAVATCAGLAGIVALSGAPSDAATPPAWDRAPNLAEFSLLALANRERAAAGTHPLVWNDDLGEAARFHSHDMADHDCFQHSSCNGTAWDTRIRRYYGSYSALGENITLAGTQPEVMHNDWMDSPGHRANILSSNYRDFGAGIAVGATNFGNWGYGTEDFGSRGSVTPVPPIPAGAVLAPADLIPTTWTWKLLVNHYSTTSADRAVSARAIVDGSPIALQLAGGTATNGTWGGELRTPRWPAAADCKRVYFEVTRANGTTFRWPSTGTIGVGTWLEPGCFDPLAPVPGFSTGPTPTTTTPTTTTTTTASTTTTRPGVGAPTVVILNPLAGDVSGIVKIHATATDDTKVKTIEVYVGTKRLVRKQGGSVTRDWNTTLASVTSGQHTITVKAYDDQGNVGTASVVVTK